MNALAFLLSLLAAWIPRAHATVLEFAGLESGNGIDQMWSRICSTLPFCNVGPNAPEFFATKVSNIVFTLITALGIIMVIYGGIKLIIARGSDEGLGEAKTIVIYAIAGIILAQLARPIVNYTVNTLLPMALGG